MWEWGPFLCGHVYVRPKKSGVADQIYEGFLTKDPNTRFHSCESRGVCPVRDIANVVQIIPITTRGASRSNATLESDISSPKFKVEEISLEAGALKRKHEHDTDTQRSRKRLKELIMKEPGHTLLEPRASWWVAEGSNERPPLISATGEQLPYYLVYSLHLIIDFLSMCHCRVIHH